MSHAKHLFKGQPLCSRWPFAQPASPLAIVHVSESPLTCSLLSLCSSEEGKAGRDGEISSVRIQTANSCESRWAPAQFPPILPVFGVTRPGLCGQQQSTKTHQSVPRCRARWQDIDSLSLSDLNARVDAAPIRAAAIDAQRLQRTVSLFLFGCLPPVSHSLSLTASG